MDRHSWELVDEVEGDVVYVFVRLGKVTRADFWFRI
jgi:hypothetical protein